MKHFLPALALMLAGCGALSDSEQRQYNRPPKHGMIEEAYFLCYRCDSASGGIYGKGPTKHYYADDARECIHEWERVTKRRFKRHVARMYDVDWQKEIPFWRDAPWNP